MKRPTRWLLAAITLCMVVAGCSSSHRETQPQATASRTAEQLAWDAIARGAPVIDVRTDAEFQAGHLPSAINIPYDVITSRVSELPADKSRTIVLYCRSGRRSGIAKTSLEQIGFTSVINGGGYEALMRAQPDGAHGRTGG